MQPILVPTWKFLSNHSIPDIFVNVVPPNIACTENDDIIEREAWYYLRLRTYENKNTKINSEDLMAIYAKLCTFQNFPLYGLISVCRMYVSFK